jgi:hypothetical protein
MSQAHDVDDHSFIFIPLCADEFFKFDTKTMKVTSIGRRAPFDEFVDYMPTSMGVNEFAIDKFGVLWYVLGMFPLQRPADDLRVYAYPGYLMRWDYLNNKPPEFLGAAGSASCMHFRTSGVCIDRKRDILYMVGGHEGGLSVLCVDLEKFRPHMYEPGPVSTDKTFRPRDMTPEEKKIYIRRGKATEDTTAFNPFFAFPVADVTPVRIWRYVPHTALRIQKSSALPGMTVTCSTAFAGTRPGTASRSRIKRSASSSHLIRPTGNTKNGFSKACTLAPAFLTTI